MMPQVTVERQKESAAHRRARRLRQQDRILLQLQAAHTRLARHHGSNPPGGNNAILQLPGRFHVAEARGVAASNLTVVTMLNQLHSQLRIQSAQLAQLQQGLQDLSATTQFLVTASQQEGSSKQDQQSHNPSFRIPTQQELAERIASVQTRLSSSSLPVPSQSVIRLTSTDDSLAEVERLLKEPAEQPSSTSAAAAGTSAPQNLFGSEVEFGSVNPRPAPSGGIGDMFQNTTAASASQAITTAGSTGISSTTLPPPTAMNTAKISFDAAVMRQQDSKLFAAFDDFLTRQPGKSRSSTASSSSGAPPVAVCTIVALDQQKACIPVDSSTASDPILNIIADLPFVQQALDIAAESGNELIFTLDMGNCWYMLTEQDTFASLRVINNCTIRLSLQAS